MHLARTFRKSLKLSWIENLWNCFIQNLFLKMKKAQYYFVEKLFKDFLNKVSKVSFLPSLRGEEWKIHCHSFPRSEGENDSVFFILPLGAREGMKILFVKGKCLLSRDSTGTGVDILMLWHIVNNKGRMNLKRHD